ncbi:MAG: peptide deformylase [Thermodesulfobacteriota bacterium]|nr:peptide deformylase [Thermodesulfobacteriota bacterium]
MKIHTYPDTVLRSPAELVKDIDGAIQDLVDEMIEIMYAAPGIGYRETVPTHPPSRCSDRRRWPRHRPPV